MYIDEVKNRLGILYDLPEDAIPSEFFDFLKIVAMGAKKYDLNGWLEEDGIKADERAMADSMFHHLAKSFACQEIPRYRVDDESGEDHLLHLACRALMLYTRRKRGIKHDRD